MDKKKVKVYRPDTHRIGWFALSSNLKIQRPGKGAEPMDLSTSILEATQMRRLFPDPLIREVVYLCVASASPNDHLHLKAAVKLLRVNHTNFERDPGLSVLTPTDFMNVMTPWRNIPKNNRNVISAVSFRSGREVKEASLGM